MTNAESPAPEQGEPASTSDDILLPAALAAFACLLAYLAIRAAGTAGA